MAKKKKDVKRRSFEAMALKFHVPKVVPDKRKKLSDKQLLKEIENYD
jgi:hypothetical protein